MSPKGTVEVVHIWKRFRADRRRFLLRDELQRVAAHLKGREAANHWRWALSDVDIAVQPGESVGLIGANGSGKSTLLKIMSRVMYPHAGRVNVSGRVGAMIEVRAGLHPDLSGRENIHMYGSLMGLARREVVNRFDEIVAFAELEDAIDRQLKFYSSGMQIRLGFAVAAFLDPDILLVDEVLAVGDAAFQHKCLERLRAVLTGGSTIVFVSHDLASVEAMCARGVWLANGVVQSDGPIRDTLASYRQSIEERAQFDFDQSGPVRVSGVDHGDASPRTQGPLDITLLLEADMPVPGSVFLGVSEGPAAPIFLLRREVYLDSGKSEIRCSLPQLPLPRGRFYTWLGFMDPASREILPWRPVGCFDVVGPDLDCPPWAIVRLAPVHVDAQWRLEERTPSFVPSDNAWGPRL